MVDRYQTHPSPQRTTVLFQAGTSKSGRAFASKHAEGENVPGIERCGGHQKLTRSTQQCILAVYTQHSQQTPFGKSGNTQQQAAETRSRSKSSSESHPFRAQAKYEGAKENADVIGGLAVFAGYTGIDLSKHPLDELLELKGVPGEDAVHSFLTAFNHVSGLDKPWTPRRLGETMALGGFHPAPVETPEMVADVFEEWIRDADVNGFNVSYLTTPGSFEDVVDLLRPELVKRGLMWEDCDVPGGLLRENLNGNAGRKRVPADHYAEQFKWDNSSVLGGGGDKED